MATEEYRRVRQLLAIGKKRGYLHCDEVHKILPAELHSAEEIDQLLLTFKGLGITVYETRPNGMVERQDRLRQLYTARRLGHLTEQEFLQRAVPLAKSKRERQILVKSLSRNKLNLSRWEWRALVTRLLRKKRPKSWKVKTGKRIVGSGPLRARSESGTIPCQGGLPGLGKRR